MRHDRVVLAYHGCDAAVAERLLTDEPFRKSENDYDWLGAGVYFWEYGADRALQFARDQQRRGKVTEPAVVGAVVQLGHCFDLLDTAYTEDLASAFRKYRSFEAQAGWTLPRNAGSTPDKNLRRLDCWVLNHYLDELDADGVAFDTVRCGFQEGKRAFPGGGIYRESHIQISVRNPACVLGVFRPTVQAWMRMRPTGLPTSSASASSSTIGSGDPWIPTRTGGGRY
jgi:hypothetical protein